MNTAAMSSHFILDRYVPKNLTILLFLSDGFREENLLGQGGFSKVYLGITRRKQVMIIFGVFSTLLISV